jgi:SAM-dependent methyltransferase
LTRRPGWYAKDSLRETTQTVAHAPDTYPTRLSIKDIMLAQLDLLDHLDQLKNEPSLGALRAGIDTLAHSLQGTQPEEPVEMAVSGDVVRISRRYILSELQQIGAAQTLERARYYLQRFEKGVTQVRHGKINDINLNRWKEYDDIHTDSLWIIPRRERSGTHSAGYWGNFVPQIPNQMMRRYTRPGEWVLDGFLGSGTTLIESQRLGRNGIGLELQEHVAAMARRCVTAEANPHGVVSAAVCGDSATLDVRAALAEHGAKSVQLVLLHPPYHDIIKFSDDPRDLSNCSGVEGFLDSFGQVVRNVSQVLDRGRYLVVVIGDKYHQGEWIPLGFQTMQVVMEQGFALKSVIVKNFEDTAGKRQQRELWKYRALVGGFYVFKHEYIYLFCKR